VKKILPCGVTAAVLFLAGFLVARAGRDHIETARQTQIVLGTVVDIQVRDGDPSKAESAIRKAFEEIRRIDALFTTYGEGSPVWKINHSMDPTIEVDPEIYQLILLCDSLWRSSGGNFDASLQALIHAWGFDGGKPHLPSDGEIREALGRSGFGNIELLDGRRIHRKVNVGFDFGAIAKGYAVDKAVETLKGSGIGNALVNAGGEIKGIGNDWVIGIQHPRRSGEIIGRLKLNGMAVATSGDYQQYFEKNAVRYHHVLNPFNGYPARGIQSVTVIHQKDAFADGLATAVFVMGKDQGMKLVEGLKHTEAMIIDGKGETIVSSGFGKFLLK
jgi:thiamine biosynthesis lipoprotein